MRRKTWGRAPMRTAITASLPAWAWRASADTASLGVLLCGAAAVAAPDSALRLIILAAVLDGLDGMLARRAGGPSAHGAALDVIADFTAFAAAPAVLALRHSASAPLAFAAAVFLGAALFRLVRANRRFGQPHTGYTGLPMPATGGLAAALAVMLSGVPLAAALLAIAALAASRIPYPLPSTLCNSARPAVVGVAVATLALCALWHPAGLLLVCAAYAVYPVALQ